MAIYTSAYTSQQIDAAISKVGNLFDVLGTTEYVSISSGTDANTLLDAKVYYTSSASLTSSMLNIPTIFKIEELGVSNIRIFNIINTRGSNGQWWGNQFIMGNIGIAVRYRNGNIFNKWYILGTNFNQVSITPANGSVSVYEDITNVVEGISNTLNILLPSVYGRDGANRGMNIGVMIAVGSTPAITFTNASNLPVIISGTISAFKGYYLDIKATKAAYIVNPIELLSYNNGDSGNVLPDGYTLLNYITKNTDDVYMDLGITGSEVTDAYEIDIDITSCNAGDRILLPSSSATFLLLLNGSRCFQYTYKGSWITIGSGIQALGRNTIKVDYKNKKVYVNGTSYDISGSSTAVTSSTLKLLGRSDGTKGVNANLYSYKHYRNGTLIMDLRPALDLIGRVGMYDIVNNKLLTHSGSIGFNAGTKVNN